MKVVNKAAQKNVILNEDYYTIHEILYMLTNKEICWFDDNGNQHYDWQSIKNNPVRFTVFLEKGNELKVGLDEYGYYTNVLVKNGKEYFVIL